jgi:hypothetical protein
MHVVRRAHLFLGLFLLPWVALYGVTAFLFNHPTAFADQPMSHFGRSAVAGTPLETVPSALDTAAAVTAELARRGHAVELVRPEAVGFSRDAAFATVKADGQTVSVLVDAATGTGTVRSKADDPPKPTPTPAPFAVGPKPRGDTPPKRGRGEGGPAKPVEDGVRTDNPLHERMSAALPAVLERCGFPAGEVTVTSSPDVVFYLLADGREWKASYAPMTGAVSGTPADAVTPPDLSARRFLLRLHTAHGYPSDTSARWWWAVIVDVMAGVMVFWAVSGFFMWWQIKATRRLGVLALAASAVAATGLTLAMYALLTRPA